MITVGGGIRSNDDKQIALNAGADKTAINTKAVKNPTFINEASKVFGSQCIVSSIEAKKIGEDKWEVYVDNGREPTGLDVLEWANKVQDLGAGEIMLTSIDKEGTKKGFDINLCNLVSNVVSIPIIASGGAGNKDDVLNVIEGSNIDAVSIASLFHYDIETINNLKLFLVNNKKMKIRL